MSTRKELQRMTWEGTDDQATEIERLKAELAAQSKASINWMNAFKRAEAQLAETRRVMERLLTRHETLSEIGGAEVRQVLTTGAGKAAADVLAAADALVEEWPEHLTLREGSERLRQAVRARRKEGRDDG